MRRIILATAWVLLVPAVLSSQAQPLSQHRTFLPGAGHIVGEEYFLPCQPEGTLSLDYDSLNMAYAGSWSFGNSYSVLSSPTGDTLFVGSGAGIMVFLASDPYALVKVGEVHARALVDYSFYDAAARRLYLAAYFSGVEIWDVADPGHPVRLSRIPLDSYPRGGIAVRDDLIYITTVANGLYIADASDPLNPVIIGHASVPGNPLVWNSSLGANHAFLAAGTSGLKIFDVTNPSSPAYLASYAVNATGVLVSGDLAYVVSSNYGLRILDVSDPQSITLLGECPIPGSPCRIVVFNGYAFIANATGNQGGGINVADVSNPASPSLLTTVTGYWENISGNGHVVCATAAYQGCLVLDVADPAMPLTASQFDLPGVMDDVAISGDYAYTGSNGFRVFDISDKAKPIQVGYEETAGSIVEAAGNVVVYAPRSMGASNMVSMMDVSDPQNPVNMGHYTCPFMTNDLDVQDHYAFVACWWDGFRILDFSNPAQPTQVAHGFGWVNGAVPGEEYCYVQALDAEGDYLYLIDYKPFPDEDTKGLYIFDISQPGNPQLVSRYADLQSSGYDVRVQDGYAYVADNLGGLEVIDVSDPLNPASVGYCTLPDVAWSLDVQYPYASVANYILGGVQIINIANPSSPQVAGYYKRTGCFALGVTMDQDDIYIADGPAGLQIYDFLLVSGTENARSNPPASCCLSPNPAHRGETVRLEPAVPMEGSISMEVFGSMGKKIGETPHIGSGRGSRLLSLATGNLEEGLYIVRISGPDFTYTGKLIIIQ
jgi:hypothetical protein